MKILSQAIKYCDEILSHNAVIQELKGDNDIKKQLCLIELDSINNQEEADILVWNLTGKSGPVRETASYKILDLIENYQYKKFFQTQKIYDTFVKAITDINPTVSRNTIEFIKYVDDKDYLFKNILKEINNTIADIDEENKGRSYVQNKKNFNLYWNLEAITAIADSICPNEDLYKILEKTAKSNDYTIREKTAKVLKIFSDINEVYKELLLSLKNDENVYVRKYTN